LPSAVDAAAALGVSEAALQSTALWSSAATVRAFLDFLAGKLGAPSLVLLAVSLVHYLCSM